jgi:putative Holliday junction resolvase
LTGAGQLILAFDFGLKRIGIATANLLTQTASPLTTLEVHGGLPWREIDRVIADWRPEQLVVGAPGSAAGTASIDTEARAFADELRRRHGLTVCMVDETLTSWAAAEKLRQDRRTGLLGRRIGRGRLDRHAACLIAEQWMREAG